MTPYYGMFTDAGNAAVHLAIDAVIDDNFDALPLSAEAAGRLTGEIVKHVAGCLTDKFSEVHDTDVRERIFAALHGARRATVPMTAMTQEHPA